MSTWVIQNCKDRTTGRMLAALKEAEEFFIMIEQHRVLNWIKENELSLNLEGTDFIPHGSTSLVKLAKSLNWKYVFHNDNFFVNMYNYKHPAMLNKDALIVSLHDALHFAGLRFNWFIRPLDDTKSFAGHVITGKDLISWVERLESVECEMNSDTKISLSIPKKIDMEWRYFIVGGKIITGSSYRLSDQPYQYEETDEAVLKEAQALADMWLPHECCVMDVALYNGESYVVEFNGLNSAGFYAHDIVKLVKAISSYTKL